MNNKRLHFVCVWLAWLAFSVLGQQTEQVRDDAWRQQRLWATNEQIKNGDFSPITEAFKQRDLDLLWSYYTGSNYLLYHRFKRVTAEMMADATGEQARLYAMRLERERVAAEYLLQIPEHARHVGDWIEKSMTQKKLNQDRSLRMSAMTQLGSDEVIVELGRFLFDDRNPDVIGTVAPLSSIGVPSSLKYDAAGYLEGVLRRRNGIAAELKTPGYNPDWFKMVQDWWLHSGEAAPYRRKLADAGYVLPPGYPMLPELKGAKSTIAPSPTSTSSLKQTGGSPREPVAPVIPQADADTNHVGGFILILLVMLLVVPVCLVLWKKRG